MASYQVRNNTWRQIIVTRAMYIENINEKNIILIDNQYIHKILFCWIFIFIIYKKIQIDCLISLDSVKVYSCDDNLSPGVIQHRSLIFLLFSSLAWYFHSISFLCTSTPCGCTHYSYNNDCQASPNNFASKKIISWY